MIKTPSPLIKNNQNPENPKIEKFLTRVA